MKEAIIYGVAGFVTTVGAVESAVAVQLPGFLFGSCVVFLIFALDWLNRHIAE